MRADIEIAHANIPPTLHKCGSESTPTNDADFNDDDSMDVIEMLSHQIPLDLPLRNSIKPSFDANKWSKGQIG